MSFESLLNERHQLMHKVYSIDRELWEMLKRARRKISPKTYKVLKMRLYERKTLEEVGKELDVTRERVRQIEHKGVIELDNLSLTDPWDGGI